VPGSVLAEVYGTTRRSVNSLHHQAVADPGTGLTVTAQAGDGSVEAIGLVGSDGSDDAGPWCAAMQWHPELMGDDPHEKRLFEEFARRCSR
jgi:putative glutamine amidotransferase